MVVLLEVVEVIAPVVLLALAVPVGLFVLFFVVMGRSSNVRDDNSPFECGFDPKSMSRVPFSLRFFLLAVVFLVFDVEVALLFPLCYSIFLSDNVLLFFTVFIFVLILGVGLFLEWWEGALDWVNS